MKIFDKYTIRLKFVLIRIIIPSVLNFFFRIVPRRKKTLLIIKQDGIGDYILFRNYLACIKNSKRYAGYKIYFLANTAFKTIAEHFDNKVIDRFFWFDNSYFLKWEVISLLADLQNLRVESIAYPNYSRATGTDWIIKNIAARHKHGFDGDLTNQTISEKLKGNSYYTELLNPASTNLHEFLRNADFVEKLTGEPCQLAKPFLNKQLLKINEANQICIFIGGSVASKRWPADKITSLCKQLLLDYNITIILAGGPADIADANTIVKAITNSRVIDITGSTSLLDLCNTVGSSRLLLTNDSAALHIAVALNVPAVCTAKGDLRGRFIPFPPQINTQVYTHFPPGFKASVDDYHKWSGSDIATIPVEDVYGTINDILKSQEIIQINRATP